jgi:hypothetical protein
MAGVAMPLLTAENYKILPETGPRYQLIEGDLDMVPAPNRYHQDISRNLEYILLEYLEERSHRQTLRCAIRRLPR